MYPRHFISLCLIIVLSVLYAPAHAQPFTQVGVGFVHLCGLSADGSVDCRTPSHAKRYEAPDDLPALQALTAGHQHSCGITLNGAAVCWGGDNYFNELDVPAIDQPLVDIVAGQHHTCAIDTNDRMWCWGLDTNGQLQVPGDGLGKEGAGFVKVAANGNATCGIEQSGSIDCWSSDINIRDTSSLTGIFTDLDVSRSMGCGLHDTGDIECWAGFIEPPSNGPYTDVVVSNIAVCGLDQNQQIDCSFRQYGDVDTAAHTSETRFISMESGKPIYGFYSNFCGVTVDGDIECIADGFDEVPGTPTAPVDLASLSISLNARFYDRNSIELFWNPSQGYPERTIEIYRNDELAVTTDARFSFHDTIEHEGRTVTYTVRAIDDSGNIGPISNPVVVDLENGSVSAADLLSEGPPLTPAQKVTDISVISLPTEIFIYWRGPEPGVDGVKNYEVRVNNVPLATTENFSYNTDDFVINNRGCNIVSIAAIADDDTIIDYQSYDFKSSRFAQTSRCR